DGHGSHNTKQFAEFAEKHKIQLFTLPPHTTHILQPLNVGYFQPLKWYQGSCLDWAAHSGSKDINKADFMATLEQIRHQTFTRSTICSGWRRCSLAPFKPD
ncbi:CENP-B protein, partial [Amniculicola lignicola CBS 123094]